MLIIHQNQNADFKIRTKENIELADITLAFSLNGKENEIKSVKRLCGILNKPSIQIDINALKLAYKNIDSSLFDEIVESIVNVTSANKLKINIAGSNTSEITNFGISVEEFDSIMFFFMSSLYAKLAEKNIGIEMLRGGGQLGVQTSGIKAGLKLNKIHNAKIVNSVRCPKDFMYKNEKNNIVKTTFDKIYALHIP